MIGTFVTVETSHASADLAGYKDLQQLGALLRNIVPCLGLRDNQAWRLLWWNGVESRVRCLRAARTAMMSILVLACDGAIFETHSSRVFPVV